MAREDSVDVRKAYIRYVLYYLNAHIDLLEKNDFHSVDQFLAREKNVKKYDAIVFKSIHKALIGETTPTEDTLDAIKKAFDISLSFGAFEYQVLSKNNPEYVRFLTNDSANTGNVVDDTTQNVEKETDASVGSEPQENIEVNIIPEDVSNNEVHPGTALPNKPEEINPQSNASSINSLDKKPLKEEQSFASDRKGKKRGYRTIVGTGIFVLIILLICFSYFKIPLNFIRSQYSTLTTENDGTKPSNKYLNQTVTIPEGSSDKAVFIFSVVNNIIQTANDSKIVLKIGYDTALGYVGLRYRDIWMSLLMDGKDIKMDVSWGYNNELNIARFKADEFKTKSSDSAVKIVVSLIHNLLKNTLRQTSYIDGDILAIADSNGLASKNYKEEFGVIGSEGFFIENSERGVLTFALNASFNKMGGDIIAFLRAYHMRAELLSNMPNNPEMKPTQNKAIGISVKTVEKNDPAERYLEMKLYFHGAITNGLR